ncbi:MAG: ATP-binding cassette domain-containing protein [Lachnospiraceae bacterium]|nr:ATP-binding cassette domain-containing protein [Lachnospiraceae bacterium]
MINIRNIKKTYNNQVVLDIENFSLEEGKIYAIIGPNGSGKSTLAKIIAGLLIDDSGIKKKIIDNSGKILDVSYLPQKPYIFDLSLEKNLLLNGNDKEKCDEMIKKFDIGYLRGKNAKKFSGGEQQKMGLARLMMKDYDLVILDEPTSAMDEISKTRAIDIIKEYAKNKTLIMITHDLSKVNDIADYTIRLECGKIIC